MVACTYGASVASGHDPTARVVISRALWETFTGATSSWLDTILDTLTPSIVTVADLCTLNAADPADLSLSTITEALLGNPLALGEVEVWAKAKLTYLAFQTNCVCNGPSGGCVSPMARPFTSLPNAATNGVAAYDQGLKLDMSQAGMLDAIGLRDVVMNGGTGRNFKLYDLTAAALLWTELVPISGLGYQEYTFTHRTTLAAGHSYCLAFHWENGDTINAQNTGWAGVTTSLFSSSGCIDNFGSSGSVPFRTLGGQLDPFNPIICPTVTVPTTPTTPTIPPTLQLPPAWTCGSTADICTRLQQISDRLDWTRRDIALIQRQSTPFAYVNGPISAGLTGHGTITVSAILGVSVVLTARPASWGKTADTPPRLIPAIGQLTFSTADGDSNATLLHYDDELILGVSGAVTSIKYSFRPGIIATIKQLVREP